MISRKKWFIKNRNLEQNPFERLVQDRKYEKEINRNISDLYNPLLMTDMDKGTDIIVDAIVNKKKILLWGDYDVDGVTATKIGYDCIRRLTIHIDYYIPDRIKDGYGISMERAKWIAEQGYEVLITVDCGVTAIEEIKYLKENGVTVVVTDHHQTKEILPEADAVIDVQRADDEYPLKGICGAMTALKMVQMICKKLSVDSLWKQYIPYAAIGTIADVMPLVSENRGLVKYALENFKDIEDVGLRTLLMYSKKERTELHEIKSSDIAFYTAPIINAAGRIGLATQALELLLETDPKEAIRKTLALKALNEKRKEIEKQIFEDAVKQAMSEKRKEKDPIVVYGEGWHKGVVGIVAARLVEMFHRPAIVMSEKDGRLEGSCRSIGQISIIDALKFAESEMIAFGGHKEAAGLKVEKSKIDAFKQNLSEYFEQIPKEHFDSPLAIDLEIKMEDIDFELLEKIERLEPFGNKNEEPIFVLTNVKPTYCLRVGKEEGAIGAHLKIKIGNLEGIGFFMGNFFEILKENEFIDIAFKLGINEYKGERKVQMIVEDIRVPEIKDQSFDPKTLDKKELYSSIYASLKELQEKEGNVLTNPDYLYWITGASKKCSFKEFKNILMILDEMKLIHIEKLDDQIFITLHQKAEKSVRETNWYRRHRNEK